MCSRLRVVLTVQWLVCALSLAVNTPDAGAAGPAPLIPRETLFGSVEKTLARLSPDGRKLAYLATDAHGVLQIQVRTVGSSDDVAVTQEPHRSLRWFTWAEDSKTILFTHDALGDENTHLFSIDLATGNTRDLTPWAGIRASLLRTDARHPDEVLITLNLRDRTQTDVWRVNLKTGATELDTQNPGDVAEWRVDATFTVRAAIAILPDGSTDVRLRESNRAPFKSWVTAGPEENLTFIDFTNDGRSAFLATSISTDMQRIVEKGLKTGTERLLSQNPASDPVAFFVSEQKHVINAVAFEVAGRQEWTTLEYGVKGDFEALKKTLTGDFRVESADRAETTWVVSVVNDRAPTAWYLWDRKGRRLTPLFTERPRLEGQSLAAMTPLTVTARDSPLSSK